MLDVITIGGATRDIFFRIDDTKRIREKTGELLAVPYGAKIVSSETSYNYGGGAVNVAVGLSRLGLKSGSSCNIGSEGTGSLALKYLKDEKVNIKFVTRDESSHTGLSVFVLGENSEHTGFLERGANSKYKFKHFGAIKPAKWFYVSSLTGKAADELPRIFEYAKRKKIKVAFNPGSSQLRMGLTALTPYFAQTEVLILNMQEAKELLAKSKVGQSPEDYLKKLAKCGPTIVVITDSEKGSWAIFEENIYRQKSINDVVVDTTGAGDCFGGTFLFGIIKGFAIPYALKISAINAASVISKMGAGPGLLSYKKIKGSKWL